MPTSSICCAWLAASFIMPCACPTALVIWFRTWPAAPAAICPNCVAAPKACCATCDTAPNAWLARFDSADKLGSCGIPGAPAASTPRARLANHHRELAQHDHAAVSRRVEHPGRGQPADQDGWRPHHDHVRRTHARQ